MLEMLTNMRNNVLCNFELFQTFNLGHYAKNYLGLNGFLQIELIS